MCELHFIRQYIGCDVSSDVRNRCFRGYGVEVGGCLSLHTRARGMELLRCMMTASWLEAACPRLRPVRALVGGARGTECERAPVACLRWCPCLFRARHVLFLLLCC